MLKEKYAKVLELGEELGVADGFVEEANGRLRIGGSARYQMDKDLLWDAIKAHDGWEQEIEADIKVLETDVYGFYTVQSGDTLSKIAKHVYGNPMDYPKIFEANRDQLDNPDRIKVGQRLRLPNS